MDKLGEFELNKIYCINALELLKKIPDKSIDLIVTDPPYFIENLKEDLTESTLRRSSKNNIFHADWDTKDFKDLDEFKIFIRNILIEFKRVLKDKAQVYMFFSYHHEHWFRLMIESLDFKFNKFLVWYKRDTMGVFPNQYGCNYERFAWFRNQGKEGRVKLHIGNGQRDVFDIPSTNIKDRKEAGFHPTPKPKKLIKQLIKNGSDKGDIVLDCFMGSGTTAIMCKETGRSFIGSELNQEYIYSRKKIKKYSRRKIFNSK